MFCPFCILLHFLLALFLGAWGNNFPDNTSNPLLYQKVASDKIPCFTQNWQSFLTPECKNLFIQFPSLILTWSYSKNHMWHENIRSYVPVAHDVEYIGRLPQKLEHFQHNNVVAKHLHFVWSIALPACNSSLCSRYVLDSTDWSLPACLLFSLNQLLSTPALRWPKLRSAQFRTVET